MRIQSLSLALLLLSATTTSLAQVSRLGEDITYHVEATGMASSGDHAPFWLTSNSYGIRTPHNNSAYLRAGLWRDVAQDASRNWRIGYGVDMAISAGMHRTFVLQQLWADVQWKNLRLGIGQKERPLELKNQQLSSGALTTGINARPVPQVRLEVPDFLAIPGTGNWLAVKAHIAYGAYTDNQWRRDCNAGDTSKPYTANSLYHSKAGFLRIGNTDKFPLSLTGGFEMSCQFGGEAWNLWDRFDHDGPFDRHQNIGHGFKQFWDAFIPGGSDANDGDYKNAAGNHLGSWHLSLDYAAKSWSARAYFEHFFEDHSQMFWQYAWKDNLYGIELNLPQNPFLKTLVYEYLRTDNQSGPVYHDATPNLPEQISSMDDYYNHHIYSAWYHAGYTMGTPLIISPLYYNTTHSICFDNRLRSHHFGLSSQPLAQVAWRVLFTHERSLGTYLYPAPNPRYGNFLLLEATYKPNWCKGLQLTAAYGHNGGSLLGKSNGALLTVAFNGLIK